MNDLTEKPLKIISKELSNTATNNLKTDDLSNIRQHLYKANQKNIPTLPKNLNKTQKPLTNISIKTKNFYL